MSNRFSRVIIFLHSIANEILSSSARFLFLVRVLSSHCALAKKRRKSWRKSSRLKQSKRSKKRKRKGKKEQRGIEGRGSKNGILRKEHVRENTYFGMWQNVFANGTAS